MMNRKRLKKIRNKILQEQGGLCHWCKRPVIEGSQNPENLATIDHIRSKAKGGTSEQSNLVVACLPCNYAKDNKTPRKGWREKVKI